MTIPDDPAAFWTKERLDERQQRSLARLEEIWPTLYARSPLAAERLAVFSFDFVADRELDVAMEQIAGDVQLELIARQGPEPVAIEIAYELHVARMLAYRASLSLHASVAPWIKAEARAAANGRRLALCMGAIYDLTARAQEVRVRAVVPDDQRDPPFWQGSKVLESVWAGGCLRVMRESRSNHLRQWCDVCGPANKSRPDRRAIKAVKKNHGAYVDGRVQELETRLRELSP